MPLYKFTIEVNSGGTYYVEADSAEDIKNWLLNNDNPKGLELGPSHKPVSDTKIEKIEELTATAV